MRRRVVAATAVVTAVAAMLAAPPLLAACGSHPARTAVSATPSGTTPAGTAIPTLPPFTSTTPTYPGLLLDSAQWGAIRAAVGQPGSLQQVAWQTFLNDHVNNEQTPGPYQVYTGSSLDTLVQLVQNQLTPAATYLRDLAIAYQVTLDASYAQRVRTGLLAWAATWRATDPTVSHDAGILGQAANQQAPGVFCFAWAYDLTAASGVFSSAQSTTLVDWLDGLARSQWLNLQTALAVPEAHADRWVPYEWMQANGKYLQYWESDRYGPGGDFPLRAEVSLVAAARVAGDRQLLAQVYGPGVGGEQPLAAHALTDSLTPRNQGDGRDNVGRAAPQVLIAKEPQPSMPDTTDYMCYNTRLAGLLADESSGLHALWPDTVPQDLEAAWQPQLLASWTYLGRLFQPGAVTSPVVNHAPDAPQRNDVIDYEVDTPRLWIGWHETGSTRLWQVLTQGNNAPVDSLYESEFVGPVTLVYSLR